jgi:hypothetical protein
VEGGRGKGTGGRRGGRGKGRGGRGGKGKRRRGRGRRKEGGRRAKRGAEDPPESSGRVPGPISGDPEHVLSFFVFVQESIIHFRKFKNFRVELSGTFFSLDSLLSLPSFPPCLPPFLKFRF